MKNLIMIAIVLTMLSVFGSPPAATQSGPESVVANLYDAAKKRNVAEMSKVQLRRYFDEDTLSLIWKAAHSEEGLAFDILYFVQDARIKNFRIGNYEQTGQLTGHVTVSFTNFGERQKLDYKVKNATGKGWRIVDINYPDGSSLTKILNSN